MTRTLSAIGATLLVLQLSACGAGGSDSGEAAAGPWTYTDGSGKTVELDERPTRIIAHAYAAAALMEFGIKPIARLRRRADRGRRRPQERRLHRHRGPRRGVGQDRRREGRRRCGPT